LIIIPSIINLELTNRCNLECVFCDHPALKRTMRKGDMPVDMLEGLLEGLGNTPVYELGLVGLGEPTLDKLLTQHLEVISRYRKLFTRISLNSNAVPMTKAKAQMVLASPINLVTFSLNSTNRASYKELMLFDKFDVAVKNIRDFMQMRQESGRDDLKISVQFMSSRLNATDEMQELFSEYLTEDVIVYNRHVFHKPALDNDQEHLLDQTSSNGDSRYPCWSMYSRAYIDIDGNVYPCTIGNDSYRENGSLLIGNLADSTLIEVFNQQHIEEARRRAEDGKLPFSECEDCTIWSLLPNNFEAKSGKWVRTDQDDIRLAELDRED
jgi:radical SAM protein with 4Fe4S-binding SPASM domain